MAHAQSLCFGLLFPRLRLSLFLVGDSPALSVRSPCEGAHSPSRTLLWIVVSSYLYQSWDAQASEEQRASNPSLSTNRTQLPNTELAMSYLAESWHKVNSLS